MKFFSDMRVATLLKKIIFYDVAFLVVFCGIILFLNLHHTKSETSRAANKNNPSDQQECASSMIQIRESNAELTHPLLLADVEKESPDFAKLKVELGRIISLSEKEGKVQYVSVYFRDLDDAAWMSIGGDQTFFPGSLIKVPILLYYLKQEEKKPGTLNKILIYRKPKENFPKQAFPGDSILDGRSYKISELLRFMIEESDNNATHLLSLNLNREEFRKVFTDFNIPPDEVNDLNYTISAREYSKFFRILYNATYISNNLSEFGLDLLAHSKFTQGLMRDLPEGTVVARKFGEHGSNNDIDFSEAGVVYKGDDPYLLVVMTRGSAIKDQTDIISKISAGVFKVFNGH